MGNLNWNRVRRPLVALLLVMSVLGGVTVAEEAHAAVTPDGRRTHTGTIDGADYRVEMPADWNGTLVLYSHGYHPPAFPVSGVTVTNSPETESWLLDHGYALAASSYRDGGLGYQVEQGYHDQLALLDWFEDHIGRPARTISTGQSMGAVISDLLVERNPDRFAGAVTLCSGHDAQNTFNAGLDVTFAVRTLLAPDEDIELVRPRDEGEAARDTELLVEAVDAALATSEGQARLALVASLNNISGWWSALAPRPTDPAEQVRQSAQWVRNAYVYGFAGPSARVDLEAKVGGNPSFNVGVDYGRQLARSSNRALVAEAYRAAGLGADGLRADLARLDAAPRIAPDPAAVASMHRNAVPRGRISVPVVTMHTVGDGGAVPDQERWYAEQVRRQGRGELLRQLYVERGQHCSFSAADEVVALQTVLRRIDTGRWPSTSPARLNEEVARFDPDDQVVTDLSAFDPATGEFDRGVMPPAFTRFTPPRTQRPSL